MISGDPGTPPRYAVPDFVALTPDAAEIAKTHRPGPVGRPGLRARVLPDSARHLCDRAGGAHARAGAVRRLARARRRRGGLRHASSARGTTSRVQVRLFNVRTRQSVFAKEYTGTIANPRLYAHTIVRRDPPAAARAARRGAHEAGVLLRPQPRAHGRPGREPRRQGDLHRRLRRRQRAAHHDEPAAEHHAVVVAGRARDRLHVVPPRLSRTSFVALIYQGVQEEPTSGRRQNFLPGVFAGRHAHRVHVEPRRQPGDLRDEPRRVGRAAHHQPSGDRHDADLVAHRHADRVHVRPRRHAADLHRRRRRPEPAADDDDRVVRGPADLVAGAVQRDRVCGAHRARATTSRSYDLATGQTRQITFGEGTNESPAYSPNGRHLAFTSTRAGRVQIFTIGRDGRGVKQITRDGNNHTPVVVELSGMYVESLPGDRASRDAQRSVRRECSLMPDRRPGRVVLAPAAARRGAAAAAACRHAAGGDDRAAAAPAAARRRGVAGAAAAAGGGRDRATARSTISIATRRSSRCSFALDSVGSRRRGTRDRARRTRSC